MKAVEISKTGGPEVLELKDITLDKPENDEVTIEHKAIGLNYIDIMQRSGKHPISFKEFPATLGMEGAGIVEAVGEDVKILNIGDNITIMSSSK